ncbi:MAG: MBL fold metallo-hydrolase [Putridiphycobacter sp.]|nr:MBL fold metallo-hydrolase [Putridiphycobacter sp.]
MRNTLLKINQSHPSLIILGNVQDAGSPHAACKKNCCKDLFLNPDPARKVVSLGLIDPNDSTNYLFEATPDMTSQMKHLSQLGNSNKEVPDAIFLTHAHIGHYTGLMYLGKEAMNAKAVKVYAMSKMAKYLTNNGPWSQLVANQNITLSPLKSDSTIQLNQSLKVIPFTVPHRDEYSETVGYKIIGPSKSALFIPDIDKWSKWQKDIIEEVKQVDYAFIDATFYDGEEINNRDISEIPHPFIIETMNLFKDAPSSEKNKIYFIHLNHTNPGLRSDSDQLKTILANGFHVAQFGGVFGM